MKCYSAFFKKRKNLQYMTTWMNLEATQASHRMNTAKCHLDEIFKIVKLIKAENKTVVAKGRREGK